jgi:hypothetical protein
MSGAIKQIFSGGCAGWALAAVLASVEVRSLFVTETKARAESAQFDYVYVISPVYLYQGRQGILLMDKRNGNVWFIARGDNTNISFRDPVFVVRVPLEKLETAR